jgi:hypothetical protein
MRSLKRILIFSPSLAIQENLETLTRKYFGQDFRLFDKDVQYYKFGSIEESHKNKSQVGLGGEILVIYDQYLLPTTRRILEASIKETKYHEWLKTLLEETKKLCRDKEIPYLDYEGEIEKKEERVFIAKLNILRKQIYSRLES